MHARCLNRELIRLGVDAHLSRDPDVLKRGEWDVIHTHGTGILLAPELLTLLKKISTKKKKPIRIHAVHGTTLGRMAACREWTWPGGYLAAVKEFSGIFNADIVLADHANLFLLPLARKLGKVTRVISNGWDSFFENEICEEKLPDELEEKLEKFGSFWVYYGRGSDPVKGTDRLIEALRAVPEIKLVASPGEGFENEERILKTGKISQGQLKRLSRLAKGLVLTSYYEGLPLVIVEALSQGLLVVSTAVGGIVTLSSKLQGFYRTPSGEISDITASLRSANAELSTPNDVKARAVNNQAVLPTWKDVAKEALRAVEELKMSSISLK